MTRHHVHFKPNPARPRLDLHCHSTCSDGTATPAELVRLAAELDFEAIALTDHDTVAGLPEFLAAAAPTGLRRLSGVEVSCQDAARRLHLVGLGIRPDDGELLAMLQRVRDWRRERNRSMVLRLAALVPLGDHAELDRIVEQTEVLGRPHLAALLVERGICRSMRAAFSRLLARGRPAYVPRRVAPLDETLRVIRGAGGIAIWAHPLTAGSLTVVKFRRLAEEHAADGLDGLEAYYSGFTPHQVRTVERVAAETGLLLSGGSDFHGDHIPEIALGVGYGSLHVPSAVLPPLLDRIAARGGLVPD